MAPPSDSTINNCVNNIGLISEIPSPAVARLQQKAKYDNKMIIIYAFLNFGDVGRYSREDFWSRPPVEIIIIHLFISNIKFNVYF